MGNSQTSYCFVQPGSVRLLNARKDRQNANIGNQDLLFTNNFWGTLVNCSKLLMDSLPQDLQCYRLMIHQPSSLKTSMTSFKELSALGTSYRELPKLVLVTLSPAKQFVMNCYCLVQQAALRFITLLKPYQRTPDPWILCQPDYWKTILMTSCLL